MKVTSQKYLEGQIPGSQHRAGKQNGLVVKSRGSLESASSRCVTLGISVSLSLKFFICKLVMILRIITVLPRVDLRLQLR